MARLGRFVLAEKALGVGLPYDFPLSPLPKVASMVLSYTSIMVLISGFVNRLVAGGHIPNHPSPGIGSEDLA